VRDRGALNFWRPAEELVGFRLGHSPQSDEGLVQQGNKLAGPENRPKDLLHLGSIVQRIANGLIESREWRQRGCRALLSQNADEWKRAIGRQQGAGALVLLLALRTRSA
jgi:hypothetical protein